MRTRILFIPLLATLLNIEGAADQQLLFQQANDLYHAGNYTEALDRYGKINPKGHATWYNMGLCQKQLGTIAEARACFERARYGAGYYALKEIDTQIEQLRPSDNNASPTWYAQIYSIMLRATQAMPPLAPQLLFLVTWYLLFIIWLWYRRRPTIAHIALLLLLVPIIATTYRRQRDTIGIIACGGGSLHTGPGDSFRTVCAIAEGDSVVVQEKHSGWYKIGHAQRIGWLPEKEIVLVTPEQT